MSDSDFQELTVSSAYQCQLKRQLQEKDHQISQFKEKLSELTETITQYKRKQQYLQLQLNQKQSAIKELIKNAFKLSSRAIRQQEELTSLKDQLLQTQKHFSQELQGCLQEKSELVQINQKLNQQNQSVRKLHQQTSRQLQVIISQRELIIKELSFKVQDQQAIIEKVKKQLQKTKNQSEQKIGLIVSKNQSLKQEIQLIDSALKNKQIENNNLLAQVKELSGEVWQKMELLAQKCDEAQIMRKTVESLKSELSTVKEQYEKFVLDQKNQKSKERRQFERIQQNRKQMTSLLKQKENEIAAMHLIIEQKQQKIRILEKKNSQHQESQLKRKIQDLNDQLASQKQNFINLQSLLTLSQHKTKKLHHQLQEFEELVTCLENDSETYRQENIQLKKQLSLNVENLNQAQQNEACNKLNEQIMLVNAYARELQQKMRDKEQEVQELLKELENHYNKSQQGKIESFSIQQVLDIIKKLSRQIEENVSIAISGQESEQSQKEKLQILMKQKHSLIDQIQKAIFDEDFSSLIHPPKQQKMVKQQSLNSNSFNDEMVPQQHTYFGKKRNPYKNHKNFENSSQYHHYNDDHKKNQFSDKFSMKKFKKYTDSFNPFH